MLSIDYPVEHLVVIDNSGTQNWMPPRVAMAKNQWNIQVPHGLGLVGAWNLIVKTTPLAPYWVLVNDAVSCTKELKVVDVAATSTPFVPTAYAVAPETKFVP